MKVKVNEDACIGCGAKYTNFTDVNNSNTFLLNTAKKNCRTREGYHQIKEYSNIVSQPRVTKELEEFNHLYQDHENRIYDINSVLEKAKENRKEKDALEEKRKLKNTNYNILASLNLEELEKYRKEKNKTIRPDDNELRGLIDTITSKTLAGEISKETSVDLLSDLMATSVQDKVVSAVNTSTNLELSKEILDKESLEKIDEAKKKCEPSTSNDIMKDIDKSFYTKSMDLSDKDFYVDDEDFKEKKVNPIIKIILFIILIALVGVCVYFIYQSF